MYIKLKQVLRPFALVLLGAGASLPALGAGGNPFFSTANQGAFARGFLLPALGETRVLLQDDWSWRAQLDLTNDSYTAVAGNETITLDGETTHLSYVLRRGYQNGWELGFEIPLYYQAGGFLDGFIEDWHGWFGLPNGGRELAPRDRYLYEVTDGNTVRYRNTETGAALGDVRLHAGWQWREGLMLRGALQFPSGDESRLAGGNFGATLWADWALPFAADSRWRGFLSAGGSYARRGEVLPDAQRQGVALSGLGFSYACTDALSLTAQLYAHSALYEGSQLETLRRPGLQASFGGSYQLRDNALLRVAVQEDPVTASSPDFSVHLALELRPPR